MSFLVTLRSPGVELESLSKLGHWRPVKVTKRGHLAPRDRAAE